MSSMENSDDLNRRSSLSIFVEDVDSRRENYSKEEKIKKEQECIEETNRQGSSCMSEYLTNDLKEKPLNDDNKENTSEASKEAIKQVMAEMERRKHEFCKLIDEHDALVKHLEDIERKHSTFKMSQQSPIMI